MHGVDDLTIAADVDFDSHTENDALVVVQRVAVDFHGSEDSDAAVGQLRQDGRGLV
jgi:hypothetical protein